MYYTIFWIIQILFLLSLGAIIFLTLRYFYVKPKVIKSSPAAESTKAPDTLMEPQPKEPDEDAVDVNTLISYDKR